MHIGSWRVALFALIFTLVLSLPYLAGAVQTPEGWQYSGVAAIPSGFQVDFNSHLAKMWQGARGDWAYHLLFTHEAHPGIVGVQAFYVGLGALANLLQLSFAAMYHLARCLFTLLMVWAIWRVACRYFAAPAARWTMLMFSTLVMGWGWLLYFAAISSNTGIEPQPIEFWLMDAYNLTGAFYMPHFAAAITLQSVAWLTFLAYLDTRAWRSIGVLTLVLALDTLIQPYVVLMLLPVFGLVSAWQFIGQPLQAKQRPDIPALLPLLLPAGVQGVLAVGQYLALSGHPVWASFTRQNITLSPPILYYVFAYLPFLLPMLLGAWLSWRGTPPAEEEAPITQTLPRIAWLLPIIWLLVVVVLLYAPLPTQRRYLLGAQTPLALLAAWGWTQLMARVRPALRPIVAIPYFAPCLVAGLMLIGGNLGALSPSTTPTAFYAPDELAGYAWVNANTTPDAIFLTTLDGTGAGSGGRFVGMTGRRAFVGHWIETADFFAKVDQLALFYNPATDDDWRLTLLRDTGISYIWYDGYARQFGTWQPATVPYLSEVFAGGDITIYRVVE